MAKYGAVFSQRYAQRQIILDLRKTGGALQTECDFPCSYTRFEIETRLKKGNALQTGGACITERIRYVIDFLHAR